MNPPLRDEADRLALIEGICDGTVDMIATDHAPHSAEEKGRGFHGSLNGVVGLETAFPVLYTELVKTNVIPLERLITLMSTAPNERFGIQAEGFTIYDLSEEYAVSADEFFSMGKSSPFLGTHVFGRCVGTVINGSAVYLNTSYFGN
jgi:dihydroorotase